MTGPEVFSGVLPNVCPVAQRGAGTLLATFCGVDRVRPVAVVLVTGMSGAGKSMALAELARRGHQVIDTDDGDWTEDVQLGHGLGSERLWREDKMKALTSEHVTGTLFISGCVANQGLFYSRFDAVVLLTAPLDVLLERVISRTTNPYGKASAERAEIITYTGTVEPLLRAGATAQIDTAQLQPDGVADELERIAGVAT